MVPILPLTRPRAFEVFAVEDTCAQLTWRRLPAGTVHVQTEHSEQQLGATGTLGAADVSGLIPGTANEVEVLVRGQTIARPTIHTMDPLEGRPLSRVATISDLHLGETGFGLVKRIRDHGRDPYPLRCARAAVREALAWGAELLVVKGDVTDGGRPEEWAMFDELLSEVPIPVVAVPGNHDTVDHPRARNASEELQRRGLFPSPVHTIDIPGARVVLIDSTVPGHSWGRIGRWLDQLASAVDIDTPVMVFTHHHFENQILPWFWPLGVQRYDSLPVLDELLAVNPDLVVSSGHTHRNRIRRHGTALVTEVSSPKDFPGVWAGYSIHPDGVRQTVRRVADPDCISWNDRTHAAVAGIWGKWSPGGLRHRSHTHHWVGASSRSVRPERTRSLSA